MLKVLKSKIRELKIGECRVEYDEGSITIPRRIMTKAGLYPYEHVEVNSKYGKGRISTYVIPGEQVELNGGAANHFKEGEIVHVNSFHYITESLVEYHKPLIV